MWLSLRHEERSCVVPLYFGALSQISEWVDSEGFDKSCFPLFRGVLINPVTVLSDSRFVSCSPLFRGILINHDAVCPDCGGKLFPSILGRSHKSGP